MIKIDWDSFIKNRVWFGWLWHPPWLGEGVGNKGEWRRISTKDRLVPVWLAWRWRGGHPRG